MKYILMLAGVTLLVSLYAFSGSDSEAEKLCNGIGYNAERAANSRDLGYSLSETLGDYTSNKAWMKEVAPYHRTLIFNSFRLAYKNPNVSPKTIKSMAFDVCMARAGYHLDRLGK